MVQILYKCFLFAGQKKSCPEKTGGDVAPVVGTGFSRRLTPYKIVGHFFGRSYKIVFFGISNISITCPHAQLIFRTVIKKLRSFFGPSGRDCSQSPPCLKTLIFRVKRIQQSTASEEDNTARGDHAVHDLTVVVGGAIYKLSLTHLTT